MRRAGYYTGIVLMILIIGTLLVWNYESNKPEFEIQSTIKNSFDNYETVDISVLVYARDYETGKLMEKVKEYYSELAGMPDELRIRLYNSKKEFMSGIIFSQKLFVKEIENDK